MPASSPESGVNGNTIISTPRHECGGGGKSGACQGNVIGSGIGRLLRAPVGRPREPTVPRYTGEYT